MFAGLIDLNTASNEDGAPTLTPFGSSSSGSLELVAPTAVCMELWHACAGPLISLPVKGNAVVYFPQGHLELISHHPAQASNLPPHVFCRVTHVKLHAEAGSDEVYAQVSLIPDRRIEHNWREGMTEAVGEDEDSESIEKSSTPHMFCKTLTASDTSTHGGFSVPRRAAEDCFPPLDYEQQRPSQELVAEDLQGVEWKFRHIYRGQPRRHLLTTGWGGFVNKKQLMPGDAVLFLRGDDGKLRLGIRRAVQFKNGTSIFPSHSHRFASSSFADIVNAISTRNAFTVCYKPRAHSPGIIIPYRKFSSSLAQSFSCGTRFKIRSETDESCERSGVIVGNNNADPGRWPNSKWKCLLVRWDDMDIHRGNRVSPWEIEPATGSVAGSSNSFLLPGTKRSRNLTDGNEVSDSGEPLRSQKVLQGQEVFKFRTPFTRLEEFAQQHPPYLKFHKVLQGHEANPLHNPGNVIHGVEVPRYGSSRSIQTHLHHGNRNFNQTIPIKLASQEFRLEDRSSSMIFSGCPVSSHGKFDSICKNRCRLFGFSLTEGSNL